MDEQTAEYKELFSQCDGDGDGLLVAAEMTNLMRLLGNNVSDAEIDSLVGINGTISWERVLEIVSQSQSSLDTPEDVIRAFSIFDKERKGYLTNSEFRKAMTNYGEQFSDEDVDEVIREADLQGTGSINYRDFVAFLFHGIESV